jgi:DNA replication protein DnaC
MNSPKTPKTLTTNDELTAQLKRLDLVVTAQGLDDLLARAITQRWSPRQLLEEIARSETQDLARRSLERRLAQARLRRFKPLADFEWHWPKKIDRPWIERALTLDFLTTGRNLILCGTTDLATLCITSLTR